jgi:hypothetical protein
MSPDHDHPVGRTRHDSSTQHPHLHSLLDRSCHHSVHSGQDLQGPAQGHRVVTLKVPTPTQISTNQQRFCIVRFSPRDQHPPTGRTHQHRQSDPSHRPTTRPASRHDQPRRRRNLTTRKLLNYAKTLQRHPLQLPTTRSIGVIPSPASNLVLRLSGSANSRANRADVSLGESFSNLRTGTAS